MLLNLPYSNFNKPVLAQSMKFPGKRIDNMTTYHDNLAMVLYWYRMVPFHAKMFKLS
jgi:hypothetical protein